MQPTVTGSVAWSVGQSVTLVSPAKTVEPIEMPFGLRTQVRPRNHVLDGVQIPPQEAAILSGKGASHCKVQQHSSIFARWRQCALMLRRCGFMSNYFDHLLLLLL